MTKITLICAKLHSWLAPLLVVAFIACFNLFAAVALIDTLETAITITVIAHLGLSATFGYLFIVSALLLTRFLTDLQFLLSSMTSSSALEALQVTEQREGEVTRLQNLIRRTKRIRLVLLIASGLLGIYGTLGVFYEGW